MALTKPIEGHSTPPDIDGTGALGRADPKVSERDLGRVRLYCRLTAALAALVVILLALLVSWLAIEFFGGQWRSVRTLVPLSIVTLLAVLSYVKAEMRLRSYALDVAPDAVTFEYGRRRSYVPLEHVQLFDTESTILLRRLRLSRCNLHTGGGMVVVSPVPTPVASAIERLIDERLAETQADQPHAIQ